MNDDYKPPIKATTTSTRILDTLLDLQEANVTVVARETGLSKSSVHNHLETLEYLGFVVKEDQQYRISLRFLQIGHRVREQYTIARGGKQEVERMVGASGLVAGLVVLEREQGICLYNVSGQKVESTPVNEGDTMPLHCTAPGKAILAALPEDRLDAILSTQELVEFTDHTLTSRSELIDDLETVRTRRLAVDREEWQTDLRGIATSISGPTGDVFGAVYVLSPMESMSGKRFQQDIPGLVLSSANQIRKDLHNQ